MDKYIAPVPETFIQIPNNLLNCNRHRLLNSSVRTAATNYCTCVDKLSFECECSVSRKVIIIITRSLNNKKYVLAWSFDTNNVIWLCV